LIPDVGTIGARVARRLPPPARRLGLALAVLALGAACGKKGPPLAPLNMAPEAPKAITARRLGDTVYLQMTVPDKSMTGRGGFSLDHLDVYAATIAPGTPTPPNRDFLKPERVIAQIPIQPPPDPDAAPPETPDPRPLPGDTITFVEKLTDALLVPQAIAKTEPDRKVAAPKPPRPKKGQGAAATEPSGAPAPPPVPVGPLVLTRVYVVQGVPKGGKGAMPSPRLEVPLLQPPGAPRAGATSADETSVTVTWEPPPSSTDEAPGVTYNVYAVTSAGSSAAGANGASAAAATTAERSLAPAPLNPAPLSEATFTHAGAEPGKQQCFAVRSVAAVGTAAIESDPTSPICITPKDTFPPAAPKGLAAVASTGVINLIWDANSEADLAGYIVLRGEAPGATLQPLMADPIKETRYTDRGARPGVRYAYEIIAVDKAGNRSAQSNRVEDAAR
jgi:hypothetical protein